MDHVYEAPFAIMKMERQRWPVMPLIFTHFTSPGSAPGVLLENNFDRDNVCHMAIKVFCSTFTAAMSKCTIITLLDDSNLNAQF